MNLTAEGHSRGLDWLRNCSLQHLDHHLAIGVELCRASQDLAHTALVQETAKLGLTEQHSTEHDEGLKTSVRGGELKGGVA